MTNLLHSILCNPSRLFYLGQCRTGFLKGQNCATVVSQLTAFTRSHKTFIFWNWKLISLKNYHMCTYLEHLIWWRHWHSDFSWGITWEMWEHCWTHIQQHETCGFCDLRQSLNFIFEGLWESLPSAHPCDIQPASIIIYYSSMQAATTDAWLLEKQQH